MDGQPGQQEPQWLTYSEAAERLNVSPHAVRMRANRFGWRKQMGNDGKARVLVSLEPRSPDERPPITRSSASQKAADPALVEALEAHVETLKAQLAEETAALREHNATLKTDVEKLDALLAAERERADKAIAGFEALLRTESEMADRAIAAFESLARRLEAMAEAKRPPWWRWLRFAD